MAATKSKKKKVMPIGKRFVKGQSGNPEGARLHNQDLKKIRTLTKQEVADVMSMLLSMNRDQIVALSVSRTEPLLRVWTARFALKALQEKRVGDMGMLLDRTIGTVNQQIDITQMSAHAGKSKEQLQKEIDEMMQIQALSSRAPTPLNPSGVPVVEEAAVVEVKHHAECINTNCPGC